MADDIAKSMSVKKRKLEQVTTNSMTSESRKFDEVWKSQQAQRSVDHRHCHNYRVSTYGDSDVISMPAGCRRHLVGKTLRNDFHHDIAEIRFVVS